MFTCLWISLLVLISAKDDDILNKDVMDICEMEMDDETENKECEPEFEMFEGHCYSFEKEMKTWHEAQDVCVKKGGNLVSIETAAEDDWIFSKISGIRVPFYIGATDKLVDGKFIWISDMKPISYSNWGLGQPSFRSADGIECVFIMSWNRRWHDTQCHHQKVFFICEKEAH